MRNSNPMPCEMLQTVTPEGHFSVTKEQTEQRYDQQLGMSLLETLQGIPAVKRWCLTATKSTDSWGQK